MDRREAIRRTLETVSGAYDWRPQDIEGVERALEQAGWVIVPREPSEAMIEAARDTGSVGDYGEHVPADYATIYRAMISAGKEGA